MSELRSDMIVNRWVIISPRRGARPHDYKNDERAKMQPGPCAFCPNHEHETGPETFAIREDGKLRGPCWRVRVVANKYPAVATDVESSDGLCVYSNGVFEGCKLPGFGSHEVVVETPDHYKTFTQLPMAQIEDVFKAYQARVTCLSQDKRFKFVQVFKNHGNAAGASMSHSHSQIIALPVVTKSMEEAVAGTKSYFERTHRCVLCDIIHQDLVTCRDRLVAESPFCIAVCPYAPCFPHETWILPRTHNSNFATVPADQINGAAKMLKTLLLKMEKAFHLPPYNFMLHTALLDDCHVPYYHWYIRIVPHLITVAGFELGSGCYINPVSPEDSAQLLSNTNVDDY
ncbi:hypothetical protein R1flu_020176 [Riccia fluitans]|uniref:Galactose-1-phosphate uridyl transferase N-terminal domain-containing protein n=1 Tax=Riccia fluitans TaxID=41844 RepID=A0ABD1ZKT5_9MARC